MQYTDKLNVWSGFALSWKFVYFFCFSASLLPQPIFLFTNFWGRKQCDAFVIWILPYSPWSKPEHRRAAESRRRANAVVWEIIVCTANCACAWTVPVPKTENHICEFCQMHSPARASPANTGDGRWNMALRHWKYEFLIVNVTRWTALLWNSSNAPKPNANGKYEFCMNDLTYAKSGMPRMCLVACRSCFRVGRNWSNCDSEHLNWMRSVRNVRVDGFRCSDKNYIW